MADWISQKIGGIVGSASMVIPGVLFLLRPEIPIKWVKASHSVVDGDSAALKWAIKVIAVGLIGLGVYAAGMLFWSE